MKNMIDQVKRETLTAFSTLKTPDSKDLIGPSTGDEAEERRIQEELAGKDWIGLDAAFLTERWSYFCYLSAEGYRYYLPALLKNCLDNFSKENDLIRSTVYSLEPSYLSLYNHGKDEDFQYQISLFNTEQHRAVCSFLGLVFDMIPGLDFSSAKALRWGWNRHEHPALVKSQNFYRSLHHFQYPLHSDHQVSSLVKQIQTAFDATPYPGDERLCDLDYAVEPAEYAVEFRGLDWRTIHPDFLAYHHASLSFFPAEAFRYFLPAYLIADLMETDSNANPVFHLTYGLVSDTPLQINQNFVETGLLADDLLSAWETEERKTIDRYQRAVCRFSHFNPQERAAIVAYLRYSSFGTYAKDEIDEALEKYWLTT